MKQSTKNGIRIMNTTGVLIMIKATIHCPVYSETITLVTKCSMEQFANVMVKDLRTALNSKTKEPTEETKKEISEEILEMKELPKTHKHCDGLTARFSHTQAQYIWIADDAGETDILHGDGIEAWQVGTEEDPDVGIRIASLGVFIHELNHVAISILRQHGVPIDRDNEESYTHYVQWLFKALSFEAAKIEKGFRVLEK
tara:strand:- start:82 stop:678 length:597 start_codon:yes stop_codon:yes gene_type:complete